MATDLIPKVSAAECHSYSAQYAHTSQERSTGIHLTDKSPSVRQEDLDI
jgi:hypothetical protein